MIGIKRYTVLLLITCLTCGSACSNHKPPANGDLSLAHVYIIEGAEAVKRIVHDQPDRVDQTDYSGKSVLMHAVMDENDELIRFLLEHGADVHLLDEHGNTALGHACSPPDLTVDYKIVDHLLEAGSDPNVPGRLLYFAVVFEDFRLCQMLFDAGADPDAMTGSAYTEGDESPRELAMYMSYEEIEAMFSQSESQQDTE